MAGLRSDPAAVPAAIASRDIEAFKSNLTRGETLYTIVQNGHAFTTRSELIDIHEQWFKDPNWTWLLYVFQLQDGEWRIVHDQNTELDYVASARSAEIEIK